MKFRVFIIILIIALILASLANPIFGAVAVITMIPGLFTELYQWTIRKKARQH